jgi:HlyD family secretion protein
LADFARDLPRRLGTAQYLRQHALLLSEIRRLLSQRIKVRQDLVRAENLHQRGLIAESAFDEQRFTLEAVERELDLSLQQTLNRWQSDRIERGLKRIDLTSETKQLREQRELHVVRAPVDGTAIGFLGLHAGLFLPAEQRLGEISPGGGLQADVYIAPRDIGFVRTGQPVSIQVDAFPYTEWGMIKGHVRDISQDFVQVGQQLAFRAVVDLEGTSLTSASGMTVELRRGMTVNARFVLEERTLFNVLYGKLSESLDPRAKGAAE